MCAPCPQFLIDNIIWTSAKFWEELSHGFIVGGNCELVWNNQ